jgi:transposase
MKYRYHIGLDAHSKNSTFAVMDHRGKVLRRAEVGTNETELLDFVRSWRGSKALVFEETMISQWLYVMLKDEVDKLVVCDPVQNKRVGAKTDRIDAIELADLLRVNRLKPVFHTDDERIELRTVVSGYYDLVQEIVRAKNRYSALYRQSAIRLGGGKVYSDPEMVSALPTRTQRFVAKPLLEQIELLEEHKERYQEKFEKNMERFKEMRLIRGIPGFGPVLTNQVVGIVVSPHRFATKYKFFSYAMLVKHRQMSDGVVYGNRRAHGNIQLKAVFKMAAKAAIGSQNAFSRKYERMLAGGSKEHAARNAVARALAATVLGVWKRGRKYDDHYREVMPRPRGCRNRT